MRSFSLGAYSTRQYFNAVGNRGSEWSIGQATITYSVPYQIVFETVDQGPTMTDGSVWLDDVNIDFKKCAPLASCDFEDGLCGFKLLADSDFDWVILTGQFGQTQNIWDVPLVDHTTGS